MTLPLENLDNKKFNDFVKEAVSQIPVYAPEWTDHNLHDPGITLIELFAWISEAQIYRLNRLTQETYLKYLKLMGIPEPKPAQPAEVTVNFSMKNSATSSLKVPKKTQVMTHDPVHNEDIIFETDQTLNVVSQKIACLLSKYVKIIGEIDHSDYKESGYFNAFQDKPKTGDALHLGFEEDVSGEEISLGIFLHEDDLPAIKQAPMGMAVYRSVKVVWEYYEKDNNKWREVKDLDDQTEHLTKSGIVRFTIGDNMGQNMIHGKNIFWIRCRLVKGVFEVPPRIQSIRLNCVNVKQIRTMPIKTFSSTGLPDFSIDLGISMIVRNSLRIAVDHAPWNRVIDLDASKPDDAHFKADFNQGRIIFGNGINGKIPPKGENNISISFQTTKGDRGNVNPGVINQIVGELGYQSKVTHFKPARGGTPPETLDHALFGLKRKLKQVTRAVTSEDYEHLALNMPGLRVARAKALAGYHPNQKNKIPGVVTVVVVPYSHYHQHKPSQEFLKTVYQYLDTFRLLTTELYVMGPCYIKVGVTAEVKINDRFEKQPLINKIKENLECFIDPIKGGEFGRGWPFGRPIHKSEIYERINQINGVEYIQNITLMVDHEGAGEIPIHGLLYSEEPTIIDIDER